MFYPQCDHHPRHGSQADSGDDEGRKSINVGVWKKFDLGMHALFSSMVLDVQQCCHVISEPGCKGQRGGLYCGSI